MKVMPISTGYFKLDGGAMFGVVPKSIWQRTNPADELNLCTWAMRCLLIEDGKNLILIDNGIGNKQDEQFFSHYFLHGNETLTQSLALNGYEPADVTHMVLTHLHFDHCGGGVYRNAKNLLVPLFNNASYIVNSAQWNWAVEPNAREKASFLKDNILPMQESGQLVLVDAPEKVLPNLEAIYVNGHTDGMMLPKFEYKGRTCLYMADLLPSTGHIPLPYVMGYDTRPLLTLDEKQRILTQAAIENWVLILEHDPINECCTLKMTDKGPRLNETFQLSAL